MALRIRFQYPSGNHLGYSIERLADGMIFDFGDGTFKATPGQPIASLPEDSGVFAGRYKATLATTPAAQFTDGDYAVAVHHVAEGNVVVAMLASTFRDGDDAEPTPPRLVKMTQVAINGVAMDLYGLPSPKPAGF